MPRGRDLIGLPVLEGKRLRRIGRVSEVLLTADASRICGLVLSPGDWLQPRRVLDFRAVTALGPTHLLAEERYLSGDQETRCCHELMGLPVLDRAAQELGLLDDFQFNAEDGRVTALQLSRGFVDDLLNGKEIVGLSGALTAGDSAILLDGPGDYSGGALY